MIHRLDNVVQPYPWGSTTAIPELLGVEPTGQPQAELWLGAHPAAPSTLPDGRPLSERIAADPVGELGAAVAAEFGARLPFLAKVLAAARPLSLQAHPSAAQARAGFRAEEERGIPIDAPHRNYRDRSHKPELVYALSPFRALAGFRPVARTIALLERLAVPQLRPQLELLRGRSPREALPRIVAELLGSPADRAAELVAAVAAACARSADSSAECRAVSELAERYPGDPGVVIALLLNHVLLRPGQALYLPAGVLHSYLDGTAVEVMANSDNVLRGGLTSKHVDVAELLRILDPVDGAPSLITADPHPSTAESFPTPAREFRLWRIRVDGTQVTLDGGQPQIVVCTAGQILAGPGHGDPVRLRRGESAYLPASTAKLVVGGDGELFRVTPNLL